MLGLVTWTVETGELTSLKYSNQIEIIIKNHQRKEKAIVNLKLMFNHFIMSINYRNTDHYLKHPISSRKQSRKPVRGVYFQLVFGLKRFTKYLLTKNKSDT